MPPVKIRWFGHSGFSLQDPSGKTILIDPWFQGNPTAPSGPEEVRKADFLLLTHDHFDHAADAAALARPTGALAGGVVARGGAPAAPPLPGGGPPLPIGSVFTMDYRQAAKAAALLKAKTVIPMHFGTFPSLEPNTDRFRAGGKNTAPGTAGV